MKKIFTLSIFLFAILLTGFSQSSYSVLNNRVVFSVLVNNDTLLIENLKNRVRLNGEMGLLEVVYYNPDARVVGSAPGSHLDSEITFRFWNEYSWLEEYLKSDNQQINFIDDLYVDIDGMEETINASFSIHRIRGTQGFTTIIEIQGDFSPEPLKTEFPDLMFKKDLHFKIILTVQVTN